MENNTNGTSSDSNNDGQTQEAVHPDDSQIDGGKDKGGDSIPKKQFLAAISSVQRTNEALQARITELEAGAKVAPAVKPATRAELLSFVADGDITQEQADTMWEKQIVERAKSEFAKASGATVLQSKVESELSGYRELVGDAWVVGSPERAKVEKEFNHLINLGYPNTKETEAAALRSAFGDLSALRASKTAKFGPSDTHEEIGGNRQPDGGSKKDVLKGLSAREKEHYEMGIKHGRYANWKEVEAELAYAKPGARRNAGARA